MAEVRSLILAIDSRKATQGAAQFEGAARRVQTGSSRAAVAGDRFTRSLLALAGAFASFAAARQLLNTTADLERRLIGVGKTTDIAGEALRSLGVDIAALGSRVPVTTTRLLEIAQAAGQMGVQGSADILRFTETVAKLGGATNLAGDEAATALARLINITGESISVVDRLGSTLVALGNTTAATEAEIAHMANQIAAATATFGTSSAEASGLGAALAALGQRAELAGSALGRTFRAIDAAVRDQGSALRDLAALTGRTEAEISRIFREDAVRGFQLFLQGIGRVIELGGSATAVLDRFGLRGEELNKVLPVMAQNYDLVASRLDIAAQGWEENIALNREAEAAAEALSARWQILRNSISELIIRWSDANSTLSQFVDAGNDAIRILFGLERDADRASDRGETFARVMLAARNALIALVAVRVIGFFADLISGIVRAIAQMRAMALAARTTGIAMGSLLGPLGLLASALAVAGAALIGFNAEVVNASDPLNQYSGALERMESTARQAADAQLQLNRALEVGDLERQRSALTQRIESLVRFSEVARGIPETKIADLGGRAILDRVIPIEKIREQIPELDVEEIAQRDIKQRGELIRVFTETENLAAAQTAIDLAEERIRLLEQQRTSVEQAIEQARRQKNAIEETAQAQGAATQVAQQTAEAEVQASGARERQLLALGTITDEIAGQANAVDRFIESLRQEVQVLSAEEGQRDILRATIDAENLARADGRTLTDEETAAIADLVRQLQELQQQVESGGQSANDFASRGIDGVQSFADKGTRAISTFGSAASSVFGQLVREGQVTSDTLLNIFANLGASLAGQLATSGLTALFGGGGGGAAPAVPQGLGILGGVFARGGVVDQPTLFDMRVGLAGEAGPEGILPLRRGQGGRLGVLGVGDGPDVLPLRRDAGGVLGVDTAGIQGNRVPERLAHAIFDAAFSARDLQRPSLLPVATQRGGFPSVVSADPTATQFAPFLEQVRPTALLPSSIIERASAGQRFAKGGIVGGDGVIGVSPFALGGVVGQSGGLAIPRISADDLPLALPELAEGGSRPLRSGRGTGQGGGSSITYNLAPRVEVTTRDATGFRKNRQQIAREVARALRVEGL